jgi:hypothetical protein
MELAFHSLDKNTGNIKGDSWHISSKKVRELGWRLDRSKVLWGDTPLSEFQQVNLIKNVVQH